MSDFSDFSEYNEQTTNEEMPNPKKQLFVCVCVCELCSSGKFSYAYIETNSKQINNYFVEFAVVFSRTKRNHFHAKGFVGTFVFQIGGVLYKVNIITQFPPNIM